MRAVDVPPEGLRRSNRVRIPKTIFEIDHGTGRARRGQRGNRGRGRGAQGSRRGMTSSARNAREVESARQLLNQPTQSAGDSDILFEGKAYSRRRQTSRGAVVVTQLQPSSAQHNANQLPSAVASGNNVPVQVGANASQPENVSKALSEIFSEASPGSVSEGLAESVSDGSPGSFSEPPSPATFDAEQSNDSAVHDLGTLSPNSVIDAAETRDALAVKTGDAWAMETGDAWAMETGDAWAMETGDAWAMETGDAWAMETGDAWAMETGDASAMETGDEGRSGWLSNVTGTDFSEAVGVVEPPSSVQQAPVEANYFMVKSTIRGYELIPMPKLPSVWKDGSYVEPAANEPVAVGDLTSSGEGTISGLPFDPHPSSFETRIGTPSEVHERPVPSRNLPVATDLAVNEASVTSIATANVEGAALVSSRDLSLFSENVPVSAHVSVVGSPTSSWEPPVYTGPVVNEVFFGSNQASDTEGANRSSPLASQLPPFNAPFLGPLLVGEPFVPSWTMPAGTDPAVLDALNSVPWRDDAEDVYLSYPRDRPSYVPSAPVGGLFEMDKVETNPSVPVSTAGSSMHSNLVLDSSNSTIVEPVQASTDGSVSSCSTNKLINMGDHGKTDTTKFGYEHLEQDPVSNLAAGGSAPSFFIVKNERPGTLIAGVGGLTGGREPINRPAVEEETAAAIVMGDAPVPWELHAVRQLYWN